MKNLKLPALILAALGSAMVAQAATFLSVSDTVASSSQPWTFGVHFDVVSTGFTINDIQIFDVQVGNTLRLGLWDVNQVNNGASIYNTTLPSTGAGGFVSVASGNIALPVGSYVLGVSGFNAPNSLGDTASGNSAPTYLNPGAFGPIGDFVSILTDPTFFNPAQTSYNPTPPRFKAVNFTYTAVPEPETYAMVAGAALVGFGLWRRRQAK